MTDHNAAQLFEDFFGRPPQEDDIVTLDMRGPENALVIGQLDGVVYKTSDSDSPYFHRFKKSDRPLLAVSADGRQIYILKGGYRFTEKGFVG